MDPLSLLGLVLGLFSVLFGQYLEGGHVEALINGPAMLIVLGGSLGAVLLETPWKNFILSIKILPWVIFPPRENYDASVEKIVMWSHVARKQGILGLENIAENEHEEFARRGLFLLVDGNEAKSLRDILELDIKTMHKELIEASRVYESLGGYSPTLGILGAVLGLIHVMNNLDDPSKLGSGIAVAFVATVYGVGLANLFFLPFYKKLKRVSYSKIIGLEIILEGLISVAEGENPRLIQIKLEGFYK